jgi:prepilin-type N-terminal cleavage/methylation domain-containing protein
MRPKRKFTMIELLAVIAVIGILAGLAFPVFVRVRESARLSSCSGRLKQINIALASYTNDSKDCLPVCQSLGKVYDAPVLKDCLAPYFDGHKDEIFHCPSDNSDTDSSLWRKAGTSYEWNTFMNGLKIDRKTFTVAGMEVSAPLAGDGESFHMKRRNYLYPDGAVKDTLEILINNEP